ncbi:MAG TPA: NADH-quinone oxidoreductase subunit NuoF [Anaerohalosphaeraceae bacterium]|nr:NADH-quinone oxidoreductase subunit NuoF [Anaerohalosphaeraceae bacterium]HQG06492.1 NADH-quinone oxidoreductase subunit NuoF [Anaerohalosphaeraceae bacterium]HQI08010.1 NADH-quinone oxidoreductase subunit NuoF [Anaerohalosphaeraceae bacterium]HQJ68310.1 NADH-quinone oxidoreductase subunit NuoF [Anaerohalosphaeraceae bacterium]
MANKRFTLTCCDGSSCLRNQARQVRQALEEELERQQLRQDVEIHLSGCVGMCSKGPILIVNPGYIMYGNLRPEDAVEIVQKHLVEGEPVSRLVISEDHLFNRFYRIFGDSEFFGRQMRIALRNCGIVDPEKLDDYLAMRGYEALARVLTEMTPQQVIEEVKKSGLRGRGGAGFPTGLKWEYTARQPESEKYVICNADEGDPGAFMDRSAIEGDPHTILEGMIIGGYAIGSHQGIIYIRAEYPLAVKRLQKAIEDARREGLLGERILGSDFSFDIRICLGAGAFVCGEETAMIHSIEGYRGMPRPRPPYPSVSGLFGKPTLINNVETWANIPVVIIEGAKWFSSIGTATSKGTKVFALAGKVHNTGLIEVPMGTTLREIIFGIGGGIPNGKKFKAVQTGGPSGGCLPEQYLDTQIDYESLTKAGSIMGSGGMIVIDEDSCMVKMAKFFIEFTQDESCGKCTPCREGTKRMLEILTRITKGDGRPGDIEKLERLGMMIQKASLCGLGQSAPNPILSTIRNFRDEYEEHIHQKKCRAHECTALLSFIIQDNCVGCGACKRVCPVNAISGNRKEKHVISQQLCIKCGQCYLACKFNAIAKE